MASRSETKQGNRDVGGPAHIALGRCYYQGQLDYDWALKEFELARSGQTADASFWIGAIQRRQGKFDEALRNFELAARLAVDGAAIEIEQAAVEARVGETDAAIEHIRHLLSIPCHISPGLLRIDPTWAPLRADSRFRKLAELDRK